MEFDNLLKLIKEVSSSELTEFQYEANGVKIVLGKSQMANGNSGNPTAVQVIQSVADAANSSAAAKENKEAEIPSGNVVKSPLVGVFYAAPAEDAEPFVTVGDKVEKGQTLAIVEAMKLMNEIDCEYTGTVAEVYVENGQAVEYGQPLFRIV